MATHTTRGDLRAQALARLEEAIVAGAAETRCLYVHDGQRVVHVSQQAERLLGGPASRLLGRPASSFAHVSHHAAMAKRVEDIRAGRPITRSFRGDVLRLDGGAVPVEIIATPIQFENRRAIQVALVDLRGFARAS